MKHYIVVFVAAALALGVRAEDDALYPVYTVEPSVGAGEVTTNWLDNCTVSVKETAAAEVTSVAFSALDKTAANFHGTFVIKAGSYLMGSIGMTNFTGVIDIQTGAYIHMTNGWLGVPKTGSAPTLYVRDGASLVLAGTSTRGSCVFNVLHMAGAGYNNIGAVCNHLKAWHGDYTFYTTIYLDDDAEMGWNSSQRMDLANQTVYFQNHTLTVRKEHPAATTSSLVSYSAAFDAGGPNGKFIAKDGVYLNPQGGNIGAWSTNGVVEVQDPSYMHLYVATGPLRWAMDWKSLRTWKAGSSIEKGTNTWPCGWGYIGSTKTAAHDRNEYQGDVRILTNELSIANASGWNYDNIGMAFSGNVSGWGGVRGRDVWVAFTGSNSWQGATHFSGAAMYATNGASFHGTFAVPETTPGMTFSNATMRLVDKEWKLGRQPYHLPPLTFEVLEGKSDTIHVHAIYTNKVDDLDDRTEATGTIASFKKMGAGSFTLKQNWAITGVTEVAEGTLNLMPANTYSAMPGLWEGIFETNETEQAAIEKYYTDSNWQKESWQYKKMSTHECPSNRVTACAYYATRLGTNPWHQYETVTYSGYIWNRSDETKTISTVGSINDYYTLYINGSYANGLYDSANLLVGSMTLKPGANKFELRMWNHSQTTSAGAKWNNAKWPLWCPGYGFAMARNWGTCDTADWHDYFIPTNNPSSCPGGDGILFTRDDRAPEDFTAEELATTRAMLDHLVMRAAGTLDLANSPLFVKTLAGAGRIQNGDVTVKDGATFAQSGILGGETLALTGKLTFKAGATLTLEGDIEEPQLRAGQKQSHTFLTAAGGIEGLPDLTTAWKHCRFEASADGKSLVGTYYPAATTVILR